MKVWVLVLFLLGSHLFKMWGDFQFPDFCLKILQFSLFILPLKPTNLCWTVELLKEVYFLC